MFGFHSYSPPSSPPLASRTSASPRTVLHLDMNSYFAKMLQQKYPHLRGKPIGITKDVGRSCLIAASKEAKTYGVKTGMSLKDARVLCPHIQPIPAEFNFYLESTRKLRDIFLDTLPDVYLFSLDEAFLELTACLKYFQPDPHRVARQLQQRIHHTLGEWVTCSIGISHNRLLAKIGSEIAPPDSIFQITDENLDSILASVNFGEVCGVGYRLEKKLKRLGITTPYQIRLASTEELMQLVGPFWSKELQKIAWGEETHMLSQLDRPMPHMKSVGRSITGYKLATDEHEIQAVLHNLTSEVTAKVRAMNLAGRQVWVGLTGSNGEWWDGFQTTKRTIRHTSEMFEILYHQLYQSWRRSFPIIKFAVRLSLLEPYGQPPLSDTWHKHESLSNAIDTINHKYGEYTLRSGVLTNRQIIYPEVTGYLGDAKYLGLR